MSEAPVIVNNRVGGTRITIWDILYYLEKGRSHEEIAAILHLRAEQVLAAVQYIEENLAEVMATHRKITERIARGNPPDLQAKLDAAHERFLETFKGARQAESKEASGAGTSGGQ